MTKRNRIILAAVILAMLAIAVWLMLKPRTPDPIYGGHRLSWWVSGSAGYLRRPSGLDSNAVPYLVQCLKSRDGPVQKAYINFYPHFPAWLGRRLGVPVAASERRYVACMFLRSMHSTARPAVPELVYLADTADPMTRANAIFALMNIATRDDSEVIECLKAAEKDKDANVRDAARAALEKIDPEGTAKAREKAAIDAVLH